VHGRLRCPSIWLLWAWDSSTCGRWRGVTGQGWLGSVASAGNRGLALIAHTLATWWVKVESSTHVRRGWLTIRHPQCTSMDTHVERDNFPMNWLHNSWRVPISGRSSRRRRRGNMMRMVICGPLMCTWRMRVERDRTLIPTWDLWGWVWPCAQKLHGSRSRFRGIRPLLKFSVVLNPLRWRQHRLRSRWCKLWRS
jgi:hypothetical protein